MTRESEAKVAVVDPMRAHLDSELRQMRQSWIDLLDEVPQSPIWNWEVIQEALLSLTDSPAEELVLRGALSAVVKEARFKPSVHVLTEVFRLVTAAHDLGFRCSAHAMVEAEMP